MSEPGKTSVPKFASFRPKAPPPSQSQAVETPDELRSPREPEHRHKHRSRRHPTNDPSVHASTRRDVRSGESQQGQDIQDVSRRSGPELEASPRSFKHDLFAVDRRGDPKNLAYGRLHRYDVPQYRRFGHGKVLGLGGVSRIDRNTSGDSHVTISTSPLALDRDQRSLSSKAWKDFSSFRLVLPEPDGDEFDPDDDFLPLRRRRQPHKDVSASSAPDDAIVDREPTEDNARFQEHSQDSDTESISQDSEAEKSDRIEKADHEIKSRNALLSRLTVSEPNNLQAWLDLIEHQEAMLSLGRSRSSRGTSLSLSERRTLADMRSAMYEKALRACRADQNSRIRLIISHMNEVSDFWESERLSEKWQDLLRQEPDAAELWTKYLDFVQADFTHFRYENCRSAYLKSLKVLSSSISRMVDEKTAAESLMELFLHVLARMTMMQQQAGYKEHALALWQAILEFEFYKPKALANAPISKQIEAFEEFWESEVARIGEPDARGWEWFYGSGDDASMPPQVAEIKPFRTGNGFADFGMTEMCTAKALALPGRTFYESESTDPYHVILFEDVRDVLEIMPRDLPPAMLVHAYLCFLSLPLITEYPNLAARLSSDPFLTSKLLKTPQGISSTPILSSSLFYQSTETLFSTALQGLIESDNLDLAVRSIESLVTITPTWDRLAEYFVALMFKREHKMLPRSDVPHRNTGKITKGLLKTRSSSLKLYNAYGIIESRNGRVKSADHVFATAIAMSSSLHEDCQTGVVLLWRTWIWESLRSQSEQVARSRILSLGDARPDPIATMQDSPAVRLKSRKTFEQLRDLAFSKGQFENAVLAIECLGLLAYLAPSGDGDLAAALATYEQATMLLEDRGLRNSSAHEYLYQARATLIAYHINHQGQYKPLVIRNILLESLSLFPSNTIFLNLYAASKSRFSIEDRLHGVAEELLRGRSAPESKSIIAHASAIADEMQRSVSASGTIHAVRAAFERAVETKVGKHCLALWGAYLDFEISQEKLDLKFVKSLFFRGLTQLPWSKDFMLRAFLDVRICLNEDELRRVFNVMEEKELRTYSDLNNFV